MALAYVMHYAVLASCTDDSGDNSEGDEAGTLRGAASKSVPSRTCHVRCQSSPDVSVPLNLTLKHSSVASPIHLAPSSRLAKQQQQQQHDDATHSPGTSQRPTAAGTPSAASTHADEVRHITNILIIYETF